MGNEFDFRDVYATKKDFKELDRKLATLDHRVNGENQSNLNTFERIKDRLDGADKGCEECRKTLILHIRKENNRIYTWINIIAVSTCVFCIVFVVIVFIVATYQ